MHIAKNKQFVEVEGEYIQTPESTDYSCLDPRVDRAKLEKILRDRNASNNEGLQTVWVFTLKGSKRPFTKSKPDGKKIRRWEKIDIGGKKYAIIDIENRQIADGTWVRNHTIEVFNPAKHMIADEQQRY